MRTPSSAARARKAEDMKPSKSDINWVIMDYLVSEGYPGAAEKFAQETNLCCPTDVDSIRDRLHVRTAIQAGDIERAVSLINDLDPEILDANPLLHFRLLQLHLIEIIRAILRSHDPPARPVTATSFLPAIQFATSHLAPRAPVDPHYQSSLERTMALMIFPPERMAADFADLLDLGLRARVAAQVNRAILEARGERREAKIRMLVRARAWAEEGARNAGFDVGGGGDFFAFDEAGADGDGGGDAGGRFGWLGEGRDERGDGGGDDEDDDDDDDDDGMIT